MADDKKGQSLLITTEEEKRRIIESCGLDEKRMKEAVATVMEWCSKEEHLKDAVPYLAKTKFVERELLLSKGSVEECKMRVDRLLKTRASLPEFCLNRSLGEFDQMSKYVRFYQLPKLCTDDLSRVFMMEFLPTENYDDYDGVSYYRLFIYILEHTFSNDMNIYDTFIADMKNSKLSFLGKVSLTILSKIQNFAVDTHGSRIKGLHILNAPGFLDKVMFLMKQTLKAKLFDRIKIHKNLEDLHKVIPKDILPADYGGEEVSSVELYGRWREVMETEETKQKMKDMDKVISDESKRITTKLDEEQLGMPGSFRKLDLD